MLHMGMTSISLQKMQPRSRKAEFELVRGNAACGVWRERESRSVFACRISLEPRALPTEGLSV